MKKSALGADLLLLMVASFWGTGSVLTKITINAGIPVGFILLFRGSVFALLSLVFFRKKIFPFRKGELLRCGLAGLMNSGGYVLQGVGAEYTTASSNAFLAATYVVMIPFVSALFFKKRVGARAYAAVASALLGMTVLAGLWRTGIAMNTGDLLSFLGAVFYAVGITIISYGTDGIASEKVSFSLAVSLTAAGGIYWAASGASVTAGINWAAVLPMLVFMGAVSSFTAQTVQVRAQRRTSATAAGLIMMTEAVFAAAISVAAGLEPLTADLLTGGGLIFFATVIMNLPARTPANDAQRHSSG